MIKLQSSSTFLLFGYLSKKKKFFFSRKDFPSNIPAWSNGMCVIFFYPLEVDFFSFMQNRSQFILFLSACHSSCPKLNHFRLPFSVTLSYKSGYLILSFSLSRSPNKRILCCFLGLSVHLQLTLLSYSNITAALMPFCFVNSLCLQMS